MGIDEISCLWNKSIQFMSVKRIGCKSGPINDKYEPSVATPRLGNI